ncbi:MAG: hypothetical protein LBR32_05525 [Propionibacteriaceae bacterium]|jgi:hypothetical protein|nr:hypothetical protein [Propionibacteriaceae bacterium]
MTGHVTRLTVDLADDDYQALRMAAVAGGKGVTISSVVRNLIRDYLDKAEDEADLQLIAARKAENRPLLSGEEVRRRLVEAAK